MTSRPDRPGVRSSSVVRARAVAAAALVIALALPSALIRPATAVAHGADHGAHANAKPIGGGALVVDGYQIELIGHPAPLREGREHHLIAKVFQVSPALAPVSGGEVAIGFGPDGTTPDLLPATEVTWAGSYSAAFTPARAGHHQAHIAIRALGERRFEPPLSLSFRVDVERRAALPWPAWLTIVFAALVGGGGVYAIGVRARHADGPLDLLAIGWVRRMLTSRLFQPALQAPTFGAMAAVVVLGFVDVQDGAVNLATKLTWTIWWAGVIFTFVIAGRVWCVACPFGALNEWSARASGASRRLPAVFRNLWWATGLFLVLTWADEQLGVVRSPRVTAWMVVAFAAFAVAVGLRYERRSFCRSLCPIGGLIGIYSMTAPIELRAKAGQTCRAHPEKQCYHGTATSRGCPMFEFPQSLDRNNYCTFCAECVRGCSRHNLALRLRAFGKDLWAATRRSLDESSLAIALVGLTLIVTAEMLTAWPAVVSTLATWLPSVVRTTLKPVTYLGLVETVVLLAGSLVVGPLLVLAAAFVSTRFAGESPGVRRTFVVFGYMFVPIGLAMHLAHNLSHLLLEGSGVVPALQRAVTLFTPLSLGEPEWVIAPLAPAPVVSLLQMAVLLGFFGLSLVAGHRLSLRLHPDRRTACRALLPFAVLAFLFTVTGVVVLNLPMGMRHVM